MENVKVWWDTRKKKMGNRSSFLYIGEVVFLSRNSLSSWNFYYFFYSWQHEWKGCAQVFSKPVQQDSNLNFVDIFAKLALSEYIIKLANSNSWITQRYFVSFNFTEKDISYLINPYLSQKSFILFNFPIIKDQKNAKFLNGICHKDSSP